MRVCQRHRHKPGDTAVTHDLRAVLTIRACMSAQQIRPVYPFALEAGRPVAGTRPKVDGRREARRGKIQLCTCRLNEHDAPPGDRDRDLHIPLAKRYKPRGWNQLTK